MVDQHHQCHHQRHGQHRSDDSNQFRGGGTDLDRLGQARKHRVLLCEAAGDIPHQVLQQIADTDGGNHDGHPRRGPQRLISHTFHNKAQHNRQNDDQRNSHGKRYGGNQINHKKPGGCENISMREVDQAQNTVYQCIAYGNQRVLSADGNTCQQIGKQCVKHKFNPFMRELNRKGGCRPLRQPPGFQNLIRRPSGS